MIPGITEHFPFYATLHQATISFEEMGGRTITTQVKVDGNTTPDFVNTEWSLEYNGELFTLNTHTPQATKDTSTRCSLIDLTFESDPIQMLKRYFFVELSQVQVGTMIINRFVASLRVKAEDFIVAFGRVLNFYFGNAFSIEVASGTHMPQEVKDIELNYTYLWEALANLYNVYELVWRFVPVTGGYKIVVGDTIGSIDDHVFQYGYRGGLLKIERQIEDAQIYNQLFGRGGEKNLPYRYFKKVDPNNELFAGDPDACKELENVYFDRLLDSNFRYYVKGWLRNPCPARQASIAEYPVPSYDEPQEIQNHWAYQKGLTDTKFDPVEYVQDLESIAEYGIRQGKLDDNDDIYPTIQGLVVSPYGRIDELVSVGPITDDDDSGTTGGVKTSPLLNFETRFTNYTSPSIFNPNLGKRRIIEITSPSFQVEQGFWGRVEWAARFVEDYSWIDDPSLRPPTTNQAKVNFSEWSIRAVRESDGEVFDADSYIPGGTSYHLYVVITADIMDPSRPYSWQVGLQNVTLISKLDGYEDASNAQTFKVWVKNIWNTTQLLGESDIAYAERVWLPILGDRQGNEAKLVFADGALSASSDWEFTILGVPTVDRTKSINGINSEWCILLQKSDAELDSTGKRIPNATSAKPTAGEHFFFVGIDMPHYYVTLAEKALNKSKEDSLDTRAYSNPTWAVQLDPVRINTLEGQESETLMSRLDIGKAIQIYDPRFTGGQNLTLTIRTLNIVWAEGTVMKPTVEIVLSENVLARSSASQTLSPTSIQARIGDAVKAATEAIWLSAGAPPYVSKKNEESVYGKKDFRDGATFGNYIGGLAGAGARIDSEGHGELDSLTVRKFLEVPELRFNRVDVQVGNYWRAPGGGLIERVEIDYDGSTPLTTGTIYLKLEEGEVASVAIDDICMGIFHDETGNATEDGDDSKGNFHFAGFSTCYFRVTDILAADGRVFKYALRPVSQSSGWNESHHPQESMTYVAYGSFSDTSRQTSRYSTRTYERYLRGINNWEITKDNIAAQFGDLSNLSVFGMNMKGYSAYLENIYMSGFIRQTSGLPSPYISFDTGGQSALADNETLTLVCKAMQGWDDLSSRVDHWSIERDSGDQTADLNWQSKTKVVAFSSTGRIVIENSLAGDLSSDIPSTLFTVTAILDDGSAVYGTIAISRISAGQNGEDAIMLTLDHYTDVMLYDREGNKIGDNIAVNAALFKGGTDISSLATNWAYVVYGCTVSGTPDSFDITGLTRTSGTVTVRCIYNGTQYETVFSVSKFLIGDTFEIVSDPSALTYNTTTQTGSANSITYEIYKNSQDANGEATRTLITTLDSTKYLLQIAGADVTSQYNSGYTQQNINYSLGNVLATLYLKKTSPASNTVLARLSVPIARVADGATGATGATGSVGVTYRWSVWKPNTQYRNDVADPPSGTVTERIVDIVSNMDYAMMDDPDLWIVQATHTFISGPTDQELWDRYYWEEISILSSPLAAPMILANKIQAKVIDVNSLDVKLLTVKNSQDAIIGRMGDMDDYTVDGVSGKFPFWLGGSTPAAAKTRINSAGVIETTAIVAKGADSGTTSIIGAFSIDGSGNLNSNKEDSQQRFSTVNMRYDSLVLGAGKTNVGQAFRIVAGLDASLSETVGTVDLTAMTIVMNRSNVTGLGGATNVNTALSLRATLGGSNYGLKIVAAGSDSYGVHISTPSSANTMKYAVYVENYIEYAIYAKSGEYAGFRPKTAYFTTTPASRLTWEDCNIVFNNSSAATISLPASPLNGQTIIIHHLTSTSLTIYGKTSSSDTNGKQIFYMRDGDTMDSKASTSREIAIITYSSSFGKWVLHFLHL